MEGGEGGEPSWWDQARRRQSSTIPPPYIAAAKAGSTHHGQAKDPLLLSGKCGSCCQTISIIWQVAPFAPMWALPRSEKLGSLYSIFTERLTSLYPLRQVHCNGNTPFIYSFSGNCAASAPIYTFMCLWAIYIFPGSIHIFPPAEKAHRGNISFAHRHMNVEILDWGPDIPFLGIFVSNLRRFVFAV